MDVKALMRAAVRKKQETTTPVKTIDMPMTATEAVSPDQPIKCSTETLATAPRKNATTALAGPSRIQTPCFVACASTGARPVIFDKSRPE